LSPNPFINAGEISPALEFTPWFLKGGKERFRKNLTVGAGRVEWPLLNESRLTGKERPVRGFVVSRETVIFGWKHLKLFEN
jgi:hypothetical protein